MKQLVKMLGFVIEVIASLILIFYYIIESIVIKLVPVKFRNLKNVSGQVVVVTGAGGGIGRLLALKLPDSAAKSFAGMSSNKVLFICNFIVSNRWNKGIRILYFKLSQ